MTTPGTPGSTRGAGPGQLHGAFLAAIRRERTAQGHLTRTRKDGTGTKITAAETRLAARRAETEAALGAFVAARAEQHPDPAPEAGQ